MSSSSGCEADTQKDFLDQIAFYGTVISITVLWWAIPVVTKIKKPSFILKAIAWSAARASQPGSAALFAIKGSATPEERLGLYYNGMAIHGADEEPMPWYMIGVNLFMDAAFSLFPAIQLLFKHTNCDSDDLWASLAPQFWYYPSVPTAVFGIWIIFDAKLFKLSWRSSRLVGFTLLIAIGLILTVPPIVSASKQGAQASAMLLPLVTYVGMSVAYTLGSSWDTSISARLKALLWAVFAALYAVLARNFGIFFAAFYNTDDDNSDPLLTLYLPEDVNRKVFGIWYLIMGIICSLFSVWGLLMKGGPREYLGTVVLQMYGLTENVEAAHPKEPLQQEQEVVEMSTT
ncbi:hypothetical protein P280DRAFT_508283 [Massarina eburnea CBS 473.64]|uniref:Uncharacterized protein n=1 Tax=Massarina eburnea CBS 473.64 TaxID=1395130 RepID=A0A6A6RYR8_9PLEO|nr:hypothetical protein P280DRAFT_508283 [Massarina eburnea CBS 473.64]